MSVKGVVRPHLQPRIGLHEALDMPVMPNKTLRDVDVYDLIEIVEIATLLARDPERCSKALVNLNLSHPIDRWFLALTLDEHRVPIKFVRSGDRDA